MESRPESPSLEENSPFNDEFAKEAVNKVGPRVYQLDFGDQNNSDEIKVFIIGCHGSGKDPQKETGELLKEIAKQSTDIPYIVLFLGDNIYDYGVTSPSHPHFRTCFYDVYGGLEPCFMLLGNHDGNYHAKYSLYLAQNPRSFTHQGHDTEINQVAHTYIVNPNEKIALFSQDSLDLASLPPWVMPYYFYSICMGDLQIFCINSNSYAADYLNLIKENSGDDSNNQADWLKSEYDKARQRGKTILLALHHPLYTSGKRATPEKFDSSHYLGQSQIEELRNYLEIKTNSYNSLLANILFQQGIEPDCVLAAHDHFLSYYNNHQNPEAPQKLRQFTCGGGGGDLQGRESFAHHPYVGCHLKQYGFGSLTFDKRKPGKFLLDIYSVKGLHLRFNEASHRPLQHPPEEQDAVKLQACIRHAGNDYLSSLKRTETQGTNSASQPVEYRGGFFSNLRWASNLALHHWYHDTLKAHEIQCSQHLMAYFQQLDLPDFKECLSTVREHLSKLPGSQQSQNFRTLLESNIKRNFSVNLEELIADHLPELRPAFEF